MSVCISVAMRQRAADSKGESLSVFSFHLNAQPCAQMNTRLSQKCEGAFFFFFFFAVDLMLAGQSSLKGFVAFRGWCQDVFMSAKDFTGM